MIQRDTTYTNRIRARQIARDSLSSRTRWLTGPLLAGRIHSNSMGGMCPGDGVMTQLRLDAVDILAFLASRNPEGFRTMVGVAVGSILDGRDSVSMATQAAAAVESGIKDSSEARLVARFGEHMRSLGRIERTTRKRCDQVMSALLGLGADVLDAAAAGDAQSLAAWSSWDEDRKGQFGQEASAILASWRVFRADLKASESLWDFTFAEVNDGQSVLGGAAALVGGRRWAPGTSPNPDVVLVNLPFSSFVGVTEHDDPAVSEVIGRAAVHLKKCKAALFRVEWDVATRIGIPASGYETALARAMPKHEIRSVLADGGRSAPAAGRDLYVAAAASWTCDFSVVTLGPARQEGIAEPLSPPDHQVAERVLRGLLRSVELK